MAARTSYEINLLIVITTVGRLFNFFFLEGDLVKDTL